MIVVNPWSDLHFLKLDNFCGQLQDDSFTNKYVLFVITAVALFNFSCSNKFDFTNPLDSQATLHAPKNLQVVSITETAVTLQFDDLNASTDYPNAKIDYEVEQSSDDSLFTKVSNTAFDGKRVVISGTYLTTPTYSYRMRAKAASRVTNYSNIVTANLSFPAPTNLAVNISTEIKATLSWMNTNSMATTVIIEKSNNGTSYLIVDSANATTATKDLAGTYSSDTTYSFRLKYKSSVNQSIYTMPVSQKLSFLAPINLQITSMTTVQVGLRWSDNSTFETSFEVEQSTDGNRYSLAKVVGPNETSTTIAATFDSATIYYFRVQAKTVINKSGYSNVASRRMSSLIDMVLVQGSTFQMGSSDVLDIGASPPHSVTVGSFVIDKYEITNEKWTDIRNWGLNHGYTDLTSGGTWNLHGTNNPVIDVSWYDVLKWCNARSEKDGLTPVYFTDNTMAAVYRTGEIDLADDAVKWAANGFRLPTEAEWEFAARGGNNSAGYTYSGSNTLEDVAWYYSNSTQGTHTVGTKIANELGIYDMSGNAYEWCWDWYGAYSSGTQTDPKGATYGNKRILRGGAFDCLVTYEHALCRIADRNSMFPVYRYFQTTYGSQGHYAGFRCTQH